MLIVISLLFVLILTAVNNHSRLVEALEEIARLSSIGNLDHSDAPDMCSRIGNEARAALEATKSK